MEHKRNTYYDDPKDNTAFERCIDVMSRMMLKYGPDMLEKIERKEMQEAHCKETDNALCAEKHKHQNRFQNDCRPRTFKIFFIDDVVSDDKSKDIGNQSPYDHPYHAYKNHQQD